MASIEQKDKYSDNVMSSIAKQMKHRSKLTGMLLTGSRVFNNKCQLIAPKKLKRFKNKGR